MRDWKQFVREHLPPLSLSGAREQEIVEEIAHQLEDANAEALRRGISTHEAEAHAIAQISDWNALAAEIRRAEQPVAQIAAATVPSAWREAVHEENIRQLRGGNFMADFWQDIRYALRMQRNSPGITAVVVITLALGIGANSAIFSVVNSVLLRPLPYRDSAALVWVTVHLPKQNQNAVFDVDYFNWRKHCSSFQDITAYTLSAEYTLSGLGDAERLSAVRATASYLHTLGITPQIGRDVAADEDIPGGRRVALLSDTLWRRRFSADPSVVGRAITLDSNAYTVVGVLPAGFEFSESRKADLLVPFALPDREISLSKGIAFVRVIARLRPGVSPEHAAADVDTVTAPFHAAFPGGFAKMFAGGRIQISSLRERLVGNVRKPLLMLLGAVGFVLLIACANIASLQMARSAAREKEIAIRGALGAGRWRLARQLFTESAAMGLLGGGAGLVLGAWLVALVRRFGPHDIPHLDVTRLDGSVVLVTIFVSLLTGILFGLAPVASAFGISLTNSLKQGSGQAGGSRKIVRLRQFLVIAELAMALVLMFGAGLLARSFVRLLSIPPGFDSHGVLTARISLPAATYLNQEQQRAFFTQLMERVQAMPGVSVAGAAAVLPLNGSVSMTVVQVEGRPAPDRIFQDTTSSSVNMTTPGYMEALHIPLKSGRLIDRRDADGALQTTLVNEAFVRKFFPNQDPLGKRIQLGGSKTWLTIIGVTGDTKQTGIAAETTAEIYLPAAQSPYPEMTLAIRTEGDPMSLVQGVRAAVASVDKNVPLFAVETLDEMVAGQIASQRFNMAMLGVFAALALLLSGVGIYGVMAYSVGQRTHEIGVRLALGALPANILRAILLHGARLAIAGVAIGLGAGFAFTRLLASMLFEVKATDPLTFIGGATLLFVAALAACWIPARRATKVDPLVALRYE